jgi:CheY-like chemotaxis protein
MRCKNILIVEDHADIRDSMEETLKGEGYEVYAVTNGRDAMGVLKRLAGPTLILLDMMMPVMNGWEFLEAHRAPADHFGDYALPVVVISAIEAFSALVSKGRPLPAIGYIRKPVSLNALLEIVQSHCDKVEGTAILPAPENSLNLQAAGIT